MVDRRKFKRLEVPVSLVIKLLGVTPHPQPINTETRNVSRQGLLAELQVISKNGSLLIHEGEETIKLIPFLVLNEKMVEVDIEIPPRGERVKATGRVVWYDFGSRDESYYLRAGIFLQQMDADDRAKWEEFVQNVARGQDAKSSEI